MNREYTEAELMIVNCARLMEDGKTVFIGYGMPQVAAILAQRLHAPRMVQVYEFGAIGAEPLTPFIRFTMGGARNCYRSIAWTNMNTVFAQAALGFIDIGVLGATQIDMYGNINSTVIGDDYYRPLKRFPGAGGATEVATYCWKTIVIMMHEKRRLVPKVDFITSPGFLDGSPGARERLGLPPGTGPYRVVTSKALMGFDDETKRMKLIARAPGVSIEEILENMAFEPIVPEHVEELSPPTNEELRILREEIDPEGIITGHPSE